MCGDYKETRKDRLEESRSSDVFLFPSYFAFNCDDKTQRVQWDTGGFPRTFPNGSRRSSGHSDRGNIKAALHGVLLAASYQV